MNCPKCGAVAGEWCRTDFPVPNGKRLPLHDKRWDAAGKFSSVGWHTFRHTYRLWPDDTGAPMGVQQKLMRHAGFNHEERVRKCLDDGQAGGQQQGRKDGIKERLSPCRKRQPHLIIPKEVLRPLLFGVIWG